MALKKTKEQIVDREQRPQKRKASTHRKEEEPEKKTKRVKHASTRRDKPSQSKKEPEYDTTEMELELKQKRKEKRETRAAKREKISKKREEENETEARKTKTTQKMMRQQKCTLLAFWKEMNKFRDEIPVQTWLILENTVVWPMIKPFFEQVMSEKQIIKKEIDIELILKHYEKETREFRFGQVLKKITPEDVNKIFGLPVEGKSFKFNKKEPKAELELILKHFKTCTQTLTKKQVDMALYRELKEIKKRKPEHVASLIILSLFTSFLFSNSTCTITWDLINVCCKIEKFNNYNWSLIVLQFLEEGLKKHNKEKPVTLSGCLILILVSTL